LGSELRSYLIYDNYKWLTKAGLRVIPIPVGTTDAEALVYFSQIQGLYLPGGPYDLVLLDLQAVSGDPAVLVTRCLALIEPQRAQTGRTARLVAFGPHVAKDRLDQAKAAGADASVSRGELLGGFPAIVKQWCG
jgi:CheY-like chemotaxis protein